MNERVPDGFIAELHREFARIGLDLRRSPYDGMASGSGEDVGRFLEHLRGLPAGATWRDVFPDMPAHWNPDDRRTWTRPYRPLGDYDYPTTPCGPAIIVHFALGMTEAMLRAMVREADALGFAVYGAGPAVAGTPAYPLHHAFVVLDRRTTRDRADACTRWLMERPDVESCYLHRRVGERFAPKGAR